MKYIFSVLLLFVLVANLGGSMFAASNARRSGAELVSLLPASDGVMILDVKRSLDVLPKLLANNPTLLARVTGHMEQFQAKTGIDIRQFDSLAAGVNAKQVSDKHYDIDPVFIARGQSSSAAIIASATKSGKLKYKEERFGERTIYIFDTADLSTDPRAAGRFSEGIAVTVVDSTTLAFGTRGRVRQTLEAKTKVGSDIIGLLNQQNPGAVTAFASKLPPGMKSFLPLENDELGKNVDSIKYVFGSADVAGDVTTLHVTARTMQNADAKSLHETLAGLQILGKAFLSGAKGADKQAYARLIENVKFSVQGNDVNMDLQVPQSDLDVLVGLLKK